MAVQAPNPAPHVAASDRKVCQSNTDKRIGRILHPFLMNPADNLLPCVDPERASEWGQLHKKQPGLTINNRKTAAINPILPAHSADPWMISHTVLLYCGAATTTAASLFRKIAHHHRHWARSGSVYLECAGPRPESQCHLGARTPSDWRPLVHLLRGR